MIKYDRLTLSLTSGILKLHAVERRKREARRKRAARRAYAQQVRQLTERQPLDQVPSIELRGPDYHLDHAVSVAAAWEAGWSPEQCADVANLQVLPRAENMRKGTASYCTLTLSLNLTSRLTAN